MCAFATTDDERRTDELHQLTVDLRVNNVHPRLDAIVDPGRPVALIALLD